MNVAPIMNSIQYARHQNQQRQHLWGILQRRLRAAVFSAVESVIAFILGFVMRFLEDYRVRAAIHHIYRTPFRVGTMHKPRIYLCEGWDARWESE
ncbi:hypothetical protein [Mycobacterium szulgai]|uniref:hypothetical protein n=1 Tax=Mycobacterium szulgai TaxID=1787 RepID=UPI00111C288A|nr:hypothetical protein [Mycobacterium szulgai]MCV7079765.1 hypothetical protein [Mycobacterium szulgai]